MLVRCLRSSFPARRFFCSSPVAVSSTNTEASPQDITNSSKPTSPVDDNLGKRLFSIRNSNSESVATVITKWKEEGGALSKPDFLSAIRGLILRHRFADALMIRDSMLEAKDLELSPSDYSYHIDLIRRVRGLQAAEKFFDGIPETMKDKITSTVLLNILVNKEEAAKAEALVDKMKEGEARQKAICTLIGMHGNMGNKDEVLRIWDKFKSKSNRSDKEYVSMVQALLKLDMLEKAKEIFNEWERIHTTPLFRSTSNLLKKYEKNGKASPSNIPEKNEEGKGESELGSEEDKVESEMG